jgi:hypothetical protein
MSIAEPIEEIQAEIDQAIAAGNQRMADAFIAYRDQHYPPKPRSVPTARGTHSGAPLISTLTMVQGTVWDNWGVNSRPKPTGNRRGDRKIPHQRYGADIELWTVDPANIKTMFDLRNAVAYRGVTRLIQHDRFAGAIDKLVTDGMIDRDYHAYLSDLTSEGMPTCSYGLLRSKTRGAGRPYAPFNVVRMEIYGGKVELADLFIDQKRFRITGWTDTTPMKGEPLTQGVLAQARMDLSSSYPFKDWDSRGD